MHEIVKNQLEIKHKVTLLIRTQAMLDNKA